MLEIEKDVNKRIQLAFASFHKLEMLWNHRTLIAEHIRIKSYRALVESILLYKCGTWALSSSLADKLDRAQRKMLRRVLGVSWRDQLRNEDLLDMVLYAC